MLGEPIQSGLQASDHGHRLVDGLGYCDASVVSHYLEHVSDPPVWLWLDCLIVSI